MFDVKVTMSLEDYEFMLKVIKQLENENVVLRSVIKTYQAFNEIEASIEEFQTKTTTFDKVFKKGN